MSTRARVKHLCYEIKMLVVTRKMLRARQYCDDWTKNALIESFSIHARNLNEFFSETSRHETTLGASDFADADYEKPKRTEEQKRLFEKAHKQIAHLTSERSSDPRRKIGPKQRDSMFKLLRNDLNNLHRHLRSGLRSTWESELRGSIAGKT